MQDLFTYFIDVIKSLGVAAISFFVATLMAILRTKQHKGKVDWVEAIMCGLFGIGIWSILIWFDIPEVVAVGLSSMIGFKGTHFVSDEISKKLGVNKEIAHNLACTRKGYQLVCKTDWVKFAINNDRLRKRGLVFLLDQYTKVHIECTN